MEQVHGGDVYRYENVIDFSANINPYGPPERVIEAVRKSAESLYRYPDIRCEKLRHALAAREGVLEEWLIFGNGAAELLFSLALAVKPKRALIQLPSFAEYARALASVDCEILSYRTCAGDGFHIREDILEQITEELDLLILCNPNNPTGTLIKPQLLEKIAEKCKQNGVYLVLDECFLDFTGQTGASGKRWLNTNPMLFILKAFTKLYSIPGVRLGYGLSSNAALSERMEAVRQPWSVSAPAQAAGLSALEETRFAAGSVEKIAAEKARMMQKMKNGGYKVYESAANYIFFEGRETLWEECLAAGILIRDCSNYPGLHKGYFRAAVRRKKENDLLLSVLTGEV